MFRFNPEVFLYTFGLGSFVAVPLCYIKTTKFEKSIKIKNKYTKFSSGEKSGKTYYMLTDYNNNIYKCDKSLWFLHFSDAELWESFEKDKEYNVKGYGVRFPLFSVYPNIISSNTFLKSPFFQVMEPLV